MRSARDFLEAGLWAAIDNAHDMPELDRTCEAEYAFGTIVMDVLYGDADSYPDGGYLDVQYDDDDNEIRYKRSDLRPHLLAAMAQCVKDYALPHSQVHWEWTRPSCDKCGVAVPESDSHGEDGEYLCPDCYGSKCPDCDGAGQPLPDGADHEQYSRCGNCRGWFSY